MFDTKNHTELAALCADLAGFMDLAEGLSPADLWRHTGLLRCLSSLQERTAMADQAALIRQATWLTDGNSITLPKAGWQCSGWSLGSNMKSRFGLTVREGVQNWTFSLLNEADIPDHWPDGMKLALGLDPEQRRLPYSGAPDSVLLRYTPYTSYLMPTQKAAIRALVTMPEGASLMVTMPTGAGKSLLFQLGALWWRRQSQEHPACVVVIVPTVGLALDHVKSFQVFPGLENCRALTGDMSADIRTKLLQEFAQGKIPILVMNPETAFHSAKDTLHQVCQPRSERLGKVVAELAAVFVDEAHIIESWGRTFRPDFQRLTSLIQGLRKSRPTLRVVLLSATIGTDARELLNKDYGSQGPFAEIHAQTARYELDLFAEHYPDSDGRDEALFELVDRLPRPAIIYTTTRKQAENIHKELVERQYQSAALFTGDTGDSERVSVVDHWRDDKLDIIVATSAFGMGIDKPDVRAVVHACLPEDATRYYQEIGRAGRDGHKAVGICLWTDSDFRLAERMKSSEWLGCAKSIERWKRLVAVCCEVGGSRRAEHGDLVLEINIDVAPERLGSNTGQHNRGWNMSLLNMMQRTGAIRVQKVDKTTCTWTVRILDPNIVSGDERVLETLFSVRERERTAASAALKTFREVLSGGICLLSEVFAEVEAGDPVATPCGHCQACLAEEEPAAALSHLKYGGLDGEPWAKPRLPSRRPPVAGTLMIERRTAAFEQVLEWYVPKLAEVGYMQFLVPDQHASHCAELVLPLASHPGFVFGFEQLTAEEWNHWPIPTVAFLDPAATGLVFQQAYLQRHFSQAAGERSSVLIVSPRGFTFEQRDLSLHVDTSYGPSLVEEWTKEF